MIEFAVVLPLLAMMMGWYLTHYENVLAELRGAG